jgi:hypothetical protein
MISATVDIKKLEEVIELYSLNKRSSKREKVYSRAYFYHRLQTFGTLTAVGKLFGRDHSTVIWGLKVYEYNRDTPEMQEVIKYFTPIFDNCLTANSNYEYNSNDVCLDEVRAMVTLENLIQERL